MVSGSGLNVTNSGRGEGCGCETGLAPSRGSQLRRLPALPEAVDEAGAEVDVPAGLGSSSEPQQARAETAKLEGSRRHGMVAPGCPGQGFESSLSGDTYWHLGMLQLGRSGHPCRLRIPSQDNSNMTMAGGWGSAAAGSPWALLAVAPMEASGEL